MNTQINTHLLMSGVDYFDDGQAINPFMDETIPVNIERARAEHTAVRMAFEAAGIEITQIAPPRDCQDGIYTANWALVRGNKAVLARLPNARKGEEDYAEAHLDKLGLSVMRVPGDLRFSGQGDALACGDYLFCGSVYRSDVEAQEFVADALGYERIQLQTVPLLDDTGEQVINSFSGWPDSFYYDIDLALSIIRPPRGDQKGLIAYCPEAFVPESRQILEAFDGVDKITVSREEAVNAFACNLVSTGDHVIMNDNAPGLKAALMQHGLSVTTLHNPEIGKGGGSIRCVSLAL